MEQIGKNFTAPFYLTIGSNCVLCTPAGCGGFRGTRVRNFGYLFRRPEYFLFLSESAARDSISFLPR